jgi:hypothetical protein
MPLPAFSLPLAQDEAVRIVVFVCSWIHDRIEKREAKVSDFPLYSKIFLPASTKSF